MMLVARSLSLLASVGIAIAAQAAEPQAGVAAAPDLAKAVSESILAALITGGPKAPGLLIRTHLGLDFTRSWALRYLTAAAGPAIVATLLFCWMLTMPSIASSRNVTLLVMYVA